MKLLLESINRGILKGLRENNIELLTDLDDENLGLLDLILAKSVNNKIDYSIKRLLIDSINARQISRSLKIIINNPNNFSKFKGLIPAKDKEHLKGLILIGQFLLGNDGNFNWIDTSGITDMSFMGFGQYFNGHIELWDVSNVTNMYGMFYNAKSFNQHIGNWDVSNVTNMADMFYFAEKFNQPIGDWDVSHVEKMSYMFYKAVMFNQPIGDWDVSHVKTMKCMFCHAFKFNQPIGDWDVSNVTNMDSMFYKANSFNQPIGDWNVSNVTDMSDMFSYTDDFNLPIGDWDVSNVTSMYNMFSYAIAFNQDISKWDVSNLKSSSFKLTIFLACPILLILEFMPKNFSSKEHN